MAYSIEFSKPFRLHTVVFAVFLRPPQAGGAPLKERFALLQGKAFPLLFYALPPKTVFLCTYATCRKSV
jgi:hypothetical protein